MSNDALIKQGTVTVICDNQKIRRIKVTCRCSRVNIFTYPGEIDGTDMKAIFSCTCGQNYAAYRGNLVRVDKNFEPEKIVARLRVTETPAKGEPVNHWVTPEDRNVN